MTSTGVTIEHYTRPEVKAVILNYCSGEHGSRALNADEHWYKGGKDPKTVMLRGPADYDATIERGRTLYATLDTLEQDVFERAEAWDDALHEPANPIGDLSNCLAFSLSTDIDGIGDIRKSISVKEAVEAAAQFHVDYLKERGIAKSIHCLYSGGGVYVHLHHGLFAVAVGNTERTPEDRKREYQVITKAYNMCIGDISQAFFRKYPQYIGKVKFDQLNNQKRTFKTIFSLHKRHPFAVIPLDPTAIKIDFKRASLPLSDEVLAEGAAWYQTFDPSEKEPLVGLIRAHVDDVRKDTREHSTGNGTISRLPVPLDRASFAPCIKNIIEKAQPIEGKHRALAILATYLYQMGWDEDTAFDLWAEVADRCRVEPRIFETIFGRISCPLCSTMQTDTGGYPCLNLFNMGFCVPDENCKGCQWSGDYHNQKILNEECESDAAADEAEAKAAARVEEPLFLQDVGDESFDKDGKPNGIDLSVTKAARSVVRKMILAMSEESDEIYRFDGQVYKPDGARAIDKTLCDLLGDDITIIKLKEILRRVRNELLDNPVKFEPDPYLLPVKNGVCDLRTGKKRDYRPDDLILDRLEVTYDPSARCPVFLAFLESITPNVTDRLMLIDWFVAHAIKEPLAYVLFLLGLGRNGKGIYEKLLKKFFGMSAFRDMPLAEVAKNNFAASGFYRKRGWIASETGKKGKKNAGIGTDFMKLVSGNGVIDGDRKNQSRIQFEPYFQTTVDTNTMPKIEDSSIGWEERFCKANLPYVFVAEPNTERNPLEKQRDPDLFAKLTTQNELSGILNLILCRSPEIVKTKTITKRPGREMFAEYADQSSSVAAFLDMFCEYGGALSNLWTPSKNIYESYETWCRYTVGEVVDKAYFGRQLKKFCGGFAPKQGKDKDRKTQTEYKGLIFNEEMYKTTIKDLQKGMSDVCLKKSEVLSEEEKSQQITMSEVSEVDSWNLIVRRFGDKDNSLYGREYAKKPQTPQTPQTSASSARVRGEPISDIPKTEQNLPKTLADQQDAAREEHFKKVAEVHTGAKLDPLKRAGMKKLLSYSEMAGFVPYDTTSPEAETICRAARGQLMKGIAPRIDFLARETGLPKESIEGYLNSAPWIRKDDSSPAGIVVYLPVVEVTA